MTDSIRPARITTVEADARPRPVNRLSKQVLNTASLECAGIDRQAPIRRAHMIRVRFMWCVWSG